MTIKRESCVAKLHAVQGQGSARSSDMRELLISLCAVFTRLFWYPFNLTGIQNSAWSSC